MEEDTSSMSLDSYSQAGQDSFVIATYRAKRNGRFVDLGAGHPRNGSNSFVLERSLGWSGVLADIETRSQLEAERSPSNRIFGNAIAEDVQAAILDIAQDGWIDFLSLDLEPPELSLLCLASLPLDGVRFGLICCEHDLYRRSRSIKSAMEGIFIARGYEKVADNVKMVATSKDIENGFKFVSVEDWWAHPSFVNVDEARENARSAQAWSIDHERESVKSLGGFIVED